jgi:Ca2+-binding EF-hand superfamily protein
MMLLFIILYIVAVFFTQAVTDYRTEYHDALSKKLEKYYASLFETMYFLFQAMCGGVAWADITSPLIELHWSYAATMLFFTCFTLLALLNIITGVFVESAFAKAQSDREQVVQAELKEEGEKMQQLDEVFNEIDIDNTGFLTIHEFEAVVADPRVVAYFRSMGVNISTAYHLFRLLDLDNSNTVSSSEFILGCLRLQGNAKNVDVATLMYENKRMMMKWVSFMDFVEEKFQEVFEAIRNSTTTASAPVIVAETAQDISGTESLPRSNSVASGDVVLRRRSWREKTLGNHSSLNIYEISDPKISAA